MKDDGSPVTDEQDDGLGYFISCYLHQDWDFLAPDFAAVVRVFATTDDATDVHDALRRVRALVTSDLTDDDLRARLTSSYRMEYRLPSAMSAREWLTTLATELQHGLRDRDL